MDIGSSGSTHALTAYAHTNVPGDPYVSDPVGIVAEPCVQHPLPTDVAGRQTWNLHMLNRDFGERRQDVAAD